MISKTSKLRGTTFFSVMLLLGTVTPAFAAHLTIDDSVEGEITVSHDANWTFGVVNNGVSYGNHIPGSQTVVGESADFSGKWYVNSAGNPDPGVGIVYILDPNTGKVSDIVYATWSTEILAGFDNATIAVDVESSPKCGDLGNLPEGFTGIVENEEPFLINQNFTDPTTGEPVSIPSNLTILFIPSEDECEINVQKSWTFTDYNWDARCDGYLNSTSGICQDSDTNMTDIGFRPANINIDDVLADPLPQDANSNYTAYAQVNKEKFQNTNPGAFYALTTIDVFEDVDSLSVLEDYSDCTVNEEILQLASKNVINNVKVAVADPNGDVTEITGDVNTIADINDAAVEIDGPIAQGSIVYVLVKFQDNLKGQEFTDGDVDVSCDNTETVDAIIDDSIVGSKSADATLRITNQ